MSNLSIVSHDLVNKISAISAFGGRVGMTLGGTEADPTLSKLPTPHAWIVPNGSRAESESREMWTKVRYEFVVFIAIPYGQGESDFIDQQLPLIESVCQAVTGTQVNAPGPFKWAFDGWTFVTSEPNRTRYALTFSVSSFYTQST